MSVRLEEAIAGRIAEDPSQRMVWWGGSWWSGGEFDRRTAECEALLREAGFQPGSRLAAFLPNSPLVLLLSVAAWRLGGTFVPLNPRGGEEWILRILEHLDPFAVILGEGSEALAEPIRSIGAPVSTAPYRRTSAPFYWKKGQDRAGP